MKKTIKILTEKMDKLKQGKDGTLQGGFAIIKGGFSAFSDSTNPNPFCTNVRCDHSTNSFSCANTVNCFM